MGLIHEDKTYALKIRESANDGSDFSNPDADYRMLFLGEDGTLHLKDSSGTVTDIGGAETLPESIIDAAGDLIIGDGADSATRLARGTDGYLLASTGSTVAWEAQRASINFVIDGGGSAITTGVKGDVIVDFACTIEAATVLLDQSGSIVVDIWKDTYANYPPTDADSITASAPPTVGTATKSQDTTLSGWTTAIAAGDTLRYNVDSITTATRATVSLKVRKT